MSVSVLDPLLFLEPHRLVQRAEQGPVGGSVGRVDILVTLGLLPVLAAGGKLTLGDMDDPMSFWTFGPPAEVFQLAFCGTHTVVSGWTCLCKTEDLEKAIRGDLVTISWKEFSRLAANEGGQRLINPVARHGGLPLLFAGRVLDCPSASVFKLDRRGAVEGLTIANDFESIDD